MGNTDGGGCSGHYTGTGRYLLMAYLQVEYGACRSSYIPTTTTTVTRARDVLYRSTASLHGFRQTRGTMAVEVTPLTGTAHYTCFADINGQDSVYSYIDLLQTSDRYQLQFYDNNADVILGNVDNSWRVGVPTCLVGAWQDQRFAFAEGGLIEYNHLGGLLPQTLQRINIGCRYDASTPTQVNLAGHFCIRRLRIWDDRLSDQDVVKLSMMQEDRVRSDRVYKLGVGGNSTVTNASRIVDIAPTSTQGANQSLSNIYTTLHGSKPTSRNVSAIGVQVATDSSVNFTPVGSSARYMGLYGLAASVVRGNSDDVGAQSNNYLYGTSATVGHTANLNMAAVTGTAYGTIGSIVANSGTITNAYGVRAGTTAGGTTSPKSGTWPHNSHCGPLRMSSACLYLRHFLVAYNGLVSCMRALRALGFR